MSDYDVIIIGANSPSLIAASYLAKEGGLKSLILEKSNYIGASAISTTDIVSGFKFHPAATGEYWVHPKVDKDFGLTKHGLEYYIADPKLTSIFEYGKYFSFYNDFRKTGEEIAKYSKKDAVAFQAFMEKWGKIGHFMGIALENPPVPFAQFVASMSATPEMEELMRDLFFGTITQELNTFFENEYVKTAFLPFMEGSYSGPSSAPFFFPVGRFLSPWGFAKGGLASVMDAMVRIAEELGITIRKNAEVVKILVKDGKAYGVRLANGEEITGNSVISNLEPAKTFIDLVGQDHIKPDLVQKINRIPYECMGVTLNLALSGLPDFGIPEEKFNGFIGVCPSFAYVEKAYAEAASGEIPEYPCSIGYMQSYFDPTFAPTGKHVLTMFVFPLPGTREIKNGTWETRKEEMLDKWVNALARVSPNIKQLIVGRGGYSPLELEQKFGMTNGDAEHGTIRWYNEMSWRPMVGFGDHRTPISSLYLGGVQVNRGGSIGDIFGRNAAVAIMEDLKKGKKGK